MSQNLARDALIIILDGEEVPGLTFFGLARRLPDRPLSLPPQQGFAVHRASDFTLYGTNWNIMEWDVPVTNWGEVGGLSIQIRTVLQYLLDSGFAIAWVGAEGLPFADPPSLFDPEMMTGGVLAWLTAEGEFGCKIDPDQSVTTASNQEMLFLRSQVAGLADVE